MVMRGEVEWKVVMRVERQRLVGLSAAITWL